MCKKPQTAFSVVLPRGSLRGPAVPVGVGLGAGLLGSHPHAGHVALGQSLHQDCSVATQEGDARWESISWLTPEKCFILV